VEPFAVAEAVQDGNQAIGDEELAARCATATLLIEASRATDVERIARRIHAFSIRGTAPFVHVPTTTLPIDLAMFRKTCADLLEAAAGGTLLLGGVEQLPAILQDRLHETLDELQNAREPSAAVRLMAGTTAPLYGHVAGGTFSARLFYRLNIIHIIVRDAGSEYDSPQDRRSVLVAIRRDEPLDQHTRAQR
jgi:DNA-binding NtrC family response regulator